MLIRWGIRLLFVADIVYMLLLTTIVNTPTADAPSRAIIGMAWGLFILWVLGAGSIMLHWRDSIRQRVLAFSASWQVKFVIFAILLALLEELITTTMTNLAPIFGVAMGEAAITASADYFEVIFFHSVIVFVPMFISWAWLLGRYDFSPQVVFLLFGITGTISEWMAFGVSTPVSFVFWLFIYGLMLYLPAYSLPMNRNVHRPRFYHAIVAVFLPIICSMPVALLVIILNQVRQAG